MKNQIANWLAVVLIVGGGLFLFSYVQTRNRNRWLREVVAEQPIWKLTKEHPYSEETQLKIMRITNELPVLPNWTEKEANELVEFFNTPYTEGVYDGPRATWEDVSHLFISNESMAIASLRMSKSGPIDKEAVAIIRSGLLEKLKSWSPQARSTAIACLAESGLMVNPNISLEVAKLKKDPDPQVARLATATVEKCSRPGYMKEWQQKSEKRGY